MMAVVVDFPQTLMEFQFPALLRRRRRQTSQPQPGHVTSTGRESVRLHSSVCSSAPADLADAVRQQEVNLNAPKMKMK